MKAVVIARYGGPEVLEIRDLPKPVPRDGELLVRVRATSVNPIDWRIRSGALKLFVRKKLPLVLGCDIAGEVAEAGRGARFTPGEAVFASLPGDVGAYAEYVAVPDRVVARKPKRLSFEEAASVPAVALTALQALERVAKVAPGQRVLVNGASGGVGIFGVQLAKVLGAHVTGVCSTDNVALVESLGADRVVDYKQTDVLAQDTRYDVVFDCIGNHDFPRWRPVLKKPSVYVTTAPRSWPGMFLRQTLITPFSAQKAYLMILEQEGPNLERIADWIEQGRVRTIVDQVLPLSEVAAAHERSATGRSKGKIVLSVQD